MAYRVPALDNLIEQWERLPGIGHKTAVRLAFSLLSMSEEQSNRFVEAIVNAKKNIHECEICCNLTDGEQCSVCSASNRDESVICVVEEPQDVLAFERMREYHGLYHVLHGTISPMNGVGPDQLRIKQLLTRVANTDVTEVIMATNPTVEGEATAMYLSKLLKPFEIKVTRLAYGIPVGGELEYADEVTLSRSFEGRSEL
ncbi:MAG: recombination protein RecR [Clostridia bacterium]|nr:recombination protein RecR [Clostridia bacterium]MBQ9860768.1 recombination protein RecR [Clostridia bacterium]